MIYLYDIYIYHSQCSCCRGYVGLAVQMWCTSEIWHFKTTFLSNPLEIKNSYLVTSWLNREKLDNIHNTDISTTDHNKRASVCWNSSNRLNCVDLIGASTWNLQITHRTPATLHQQSARPRGFWIPRLRERIFRGGGCTPFYQQDPEGCCAHAHWGQSTGAWEVGKGVLMAENVRSPFDYREPPTLDSDGDGSKPPPPRGWVGTEKPDASLNPGRGREACVCACLCACVVFTGASVCKMRLFG